MDFLAVAPEPSTGIHNKLKTLYKSLVPLDKQALVLDPIYYILKELGLLFEINQKHRDLILLIAEDVHLYSSMLRDFSPFKSQDNSTVSWEGVKNTVMGIIKESIHPSPDLLAKVTEGLRFRDSIMGARNQELCAIKLGFAMYYRKICD
jgi:hypothetical protein